MEVLSNLNFRFGTSSRDDALNKVKRENYPGPGNYTTGFVDNPNRSFKFGTEKRDKGAVNGTPGPGQYRIPCSIVDVAGYNANGAFDGTYKYI